MARGNFDIWFFILVIVLSSIGLIMMFSASYVSARNETGDPLHYFKRQAMFVVAGIFIMLFVSKIHFRLFRSFSKIAIAGSIVLLILVLFMHSNVSGEEDFKRWMVIPIINQEFQPSEVAKLGLIWFLAWSFEKNQNKIRTQDWRVLIPYVVLISVMCGLVALEHHLSGTLLMLAIGLVMTFLGGFRIRWYALGGAALLVVAVIMVIEREQLPDRIQARLDAWLDPNYDPLGARWQVNQSLRAIGSGGLFGTGLGQSHQKYLYLPEPQNDFVFAIVCEELGYVGAISIIFLFVVFIWRGFVIAMNVNNKFASLLVMGIMFQVGIQTALNICVVTGIMPNTGISLPFFSYGGTALLMLMVELGMVLSVSRYADVSKK